MTADVQRELAEVIDRHAVRGTTVPDLAAALVPTVQALAAQAAEPLRRVLADLTEAVGRGDEVGLPEAYRAAIAALDPSGAAEGAGR